MIPQEHCQRMVQLPVGWSLMDSHLLVPIFRRETPTTGVYLHTAVASISWKFKWSTFVISEECVGDTCNYSSKQVLCILYGLGHSRVVKMNLDSGLISGVRVWHSFESPLWYTMFSKGSGGIHGTLQGIYILYNMYTNNPLSFTVLTVPLYTYWYA